MLNAIHFYIITYSLHKICSDTLQIAPHTLSLSIISGVGGSVYTTCGSVHAITSLNDSSRGQKYAAVQVSPHNIVTASHATKYSCSIFLIPSPPVCFIYTHTQLSSERVIYILLQCSYTPHTHFTRAIKSNFAKYPVAIPACVSLMKEPFPRRRTGHKHLHQFLLLDIQI